MRNLFMLLALSLMSIPYTLAEDSLWEPLSNPFPTGPAWDFVIAPDGTYYASSWLHGVARSTNKGVSWTPHNTGMPTQPATLEAQALDVSALGEPEAPLLQETGAENFLQVHGLGVNALGEPLAGINGLSAPYNAKACRFTDGQWRLATGATANIRIRNFCLSKSGAVFCVTQWQGDIFRSTDHGTTFTRVAESRIVTGKLGALMTIMQGLDGTLYAGGEADGIWRSTDDGQTWQVIGLRFGDGYDGNLWGIGSNLQGEIIAVGKGKRGAGIFRLGNLDQTWVASNTGIPPYAHTRSIIERPDAAGHLFCGSAHGVFRSQDGGVTWTPFTTGLPVNSVDKSYIVRALVHDAQGYLHARTMNGLFRTRQPTATGNQPPSVNVGVNQGHPQEQGDDRSRPAP